MPEGSGSPLLRLMAWLSPAFPVGSFSYSHGLECAVHHGLVNDRDALEAWIGALVTRGSGWNDAVLLAESRRRARHGGDLSELAELAEAMAGSAERHLETTLQGGAFLQGASAWSAGFTETLTANCPYPVAIGSVAGANGIPCEDLCSAFLQAFVSNQLQVAIRLSVIGQSDAVAILAELENTLTETARRAAQSSLDDLGSSTLAAEVATMRHETQYSRLFRS